MSTATSGASVSSLRSRLLRRDLWRLGTMGLRARPTRAILSALGIAIGIAAMIAVVGISASSQARLNAQLEQLGTNLLTVVPGQTFAGKNAALPEDSIGKVGILPGVESVSGVALLEANVYRSSFIDPSATGSLGVYAADLDLLTVTGTHLAAGGWLNAANQGYPAVVLGAAAAERLGVTQAGALVWLGGQDVEVVGILAPSPLAPELDTAALVGIPYATAQLDYDGSPTVLYERSSDGMVGQLQSTLGPTINPENPEEVKVSRPSDALAAKNAADQAFTGLLVGLGAVALLVGGIGVANTMIISVLERRREIGLRRAIGATRGHIGSQFLTEALLLSGLGGVLGVLLGTGVTAVISLMNAWPPTVPGAALAAGVAATVAIGAVAGLYPAIRAARVPPTSALS
jgi:putative ABC transport system permease protein